MENRKRGMEPNDMHKGAACYYGGRRHLVDAVKLGGLAGPHATLTCDHDDNDREECDGPNGHSWTSIYLLTVDE